MKKINLGLFFACAAAGLSAQNPSSHNLNLSAVLPYMLLFGLPTMSALYLFVLFLVKKSQSPRWVYLSAVIGLLAGALLVYQLQQTEASQIPYTQTEQQNSLANSYNQSKEGQNKQIYNNFFVLNMSNLTILGLAAVVQWFRNKEKAAR